MQVNACCLQWQDAVSRKAVQFNLQLRRLLLSGCWQGLKRALAAGQEVLSSSGCLLQLWLLQWCCQKDPPFNAWGM